MRTSNGLKQHSAGISLVILAIGFVLLGLLAFINRPERDLAASTLLENNGSVIGSIVSIFAGVIFLVAAWLYWSRSSAVITTEHREEQPRSMRSGVLSLK
jgi:riboflavin transporter FmnP